MSKINLAIISPHGNSYSETFIQAHKNYLDANVFYYYGGSIPNNLEGKGTINPIIKKGVNKAVAIVKGDMEWGIRKALRDSFKAENIDVVLAEYGNTGTRILSICKELNLPMVVHFHGYDASLYETVKQNNDYKEIFAYAKAIIAVSSVMENMLLELGCPREKLIRNTYGPNDAFAQLNPTYSDELFVGIGRFVDKKAPYYTIMAFAQVVKEFPNAQLVIGGDGLLFNTCENMVQYLKLENNVHLLGIIKPEVYQSYLLKAKAFVQHSVRAKNGDMEGTPLAVLEASSAGVPVIASKHAGIPDVIVDGETGLLFDEHDVDAMANAMLKVLRDKELSEKLGLAGKAFIKENYSMSRHIKHLDQIIKEALN